MEDINNNSVLNGDFDESMIIDLSEFESQNIVLSIIDTLVSNISIAFILIIIFFIFFRGGFRSFNIIVISLLFYIVLNVIIHLSVGESYILATVAINKILNVTVINYGHYLLIYGSIFSILVNLVILLPIRYILNIKNIKVDYIQMFRIFFLYSILVLLYSVYDIEYNYGGFESIAEGYNFQSSEIYIFLIIISGLISSLISYKIAFHQNKNPD